MKKDNKSKNKMIIVDSAEKVKLLSPSSQKHHYQAMKNLREIKD